MRLTISKHARLIFILLGVILFTTLVWYVVSQTFMRDRSALFLEETTGSSLDEQRSISLPTRLKIPALRVDAPIEYVGLTSDGAMDIPKGPDGVGWFHLGLRPGENGTAVMAGHYGWINNIPAVFDHLSQLGIGDKVFVEDELGVITTFIVREIRTYHKDEAAPEVFGSSDGVAHLNLITCTGDWNTEEKTRSERLVIFTDKE